MQIPENYSGTTVMPHARPGENEPLSAGGQMPEQAEPAPPPGSPRQGAEPHRGKPAARPEGEEAPPGGETSWGEEEKEAYSAGAERTNGEGQPPGVPPGETPAFAGAGGKKLTPSGGILNFHALAERFPFLSSLLPPKRKEKPQSNNDLLLILGVLLLLSEGQDGDILPLLLILLLV